MPKKKPPRNAFFFFMLDYKARCERNGEHFPNGLRDVQIEAGPEWNDMPPPEKKKYEDMAKEEKIRLKGDTHYKQTNCHNSFASMDRQKAEEEQKKYNITKYIEGKIRSLQSRKLLAEAKFYLAHTNYFCISENECYHPAEIAIVEFCLGEGITNVYHTIVDPGPIPLGYRHDAIQKSEATHKIPIDNNGGEKSFYKIFKSIKNFLEAGRAANNGEYPPLYTLRDNVNFNTSMNAVKSILGNLYLSEPDYSGSEIFEDYPIYPLDKLFFELQVACHSRFPEDGHDEYDNENEDCDGPFLKAFPTISFAQMEFEKDMFNLTTNIACTFHIEEDLVQFCSKSYVQRWAFLMCEHCCGGLNITVIPGRHLPETSDVFHKQVKHLEKEDREQPAKTKPFVWVDHSKSDMPSASSWVPVERPSLPRPRVQPNLAAMLPKEKLSEPFNASEENFPAIPISRGRGGRLLGRGSGRGGGPISFADAMKNKK